MKRTAMFLQMVLGAAALMAVYGCAHSPGGIASSTTPIEGRAYDIVGPASGTSSRVRLFGIIPVSGSSSIRAARDSAIRSNRADALIDVTASAYTHFYILFSRDVVKVEGVAIRFKN